MPWVRVDEHFYDHPKWHDAPGDSIALWLASTAWCNRNDSTTGFIPESKTRGLVNVKRVASTLKDLCERGAFHRVPGGYQIHDYEEYQQPEKVKEIASKRAAAGRKGAAHRWQAARVAKEHAAAPLPEPEDDPPIANRMANAIAKTCPDTDTDTDTERLPSVGTLSLVPTACHREREIVFGLVADHRRTKRRSAPDNEDGWRFTVLSNLRRTEGELVDRMLADGDTPEAIAAFIIETGGVTSAPPKDTRVPWCDESCPTCGPGGITAWIDTGDGLAPCPDRRLA